MADHNFHRTELSEQEKSEIQSSWNKIIGSIPHWMTRNEIHIPFIGLNPVKIYNHECVANIECTIKVCQHAIDKFWYYFDEHKKIISIIDERKKNPITLDSYVLSVKFLDSVKKCEKLNYGRAMTKINYIGRELSDDMNHNVPAHQKFIIEAELAIDNWNNLSQEDQDQMTIAHLFDLERARMESEEKERIGTEKKLSIMRKKYREYYDKKLKRLRLKDLAKIRAIRSFDTGDISELPEEPTMHYKSYDELLDPKLYDKIYFSAVSAGLVFHNNCIRGLCSCENHNKGEADLEPNGQKTPASAPGED